MMQRAPVNAYHKIFLYTLMFSECIETEKCHEMLQVSGKKLNYSSQLSTHKNKFTRAFSSQLSVSSRLMDMLDDAMSTT